MSLRNRWWKFALIFWLGILLFSSTRMAGWLGRGVYGHFLRQFVRPMGIDSSAAQKILHVILFGVFGWLLASVKIPPRSPWLRGLIWSFAIGATTELLQIAVRGRHPQFSDVILNGVTGTLSCWLALWWASRRRAPEAQEPG